MIEAHKSQAPITDILSSCIKTLVMTKNKGVPMDQTRSYAQCQTVVGYFENRDQAQLGLQLCAMLASPQRTLAWPTAATRERATALQLNTPPMACGKK
jgi:hypothetical protein